MGNLMKYLNCGSIVQAHGRDIVRFVVTKFEDIDKIIIPLIEKYPLQGVKAKDFADFCKVADLIRKKAHLTSEGLEQIRVIKSGMNKGRNYDD
jgi:hypothetical protein